MHKVSSAYWRWEICCPSRAMGNHVNKFWDTAFLITPLKPSATKQEMERGKRISLFKPLLISIFDIEFPLTKTERFPAKIQAPIHSIHLLQKPNLCNIYSMKPQPTESYAFSKSTFNIRHSLPVFLARSTTSFTIIILSTRFLPIRKPIERSQSPSS
ncbi:hypothetical protein QL285_080620 [Trifolium repens]|nr:hypothetical protein QL285_080620 [Trifolium repens]